MEEEGMDELGEEEIRLFPSSKWCFPEKKVKGKRRESGRWGWRWLRKEENLVRRVCKGWKRERERKKSEWRRTNSSRKFGRKDGNRMGRREERRGKWWRKKRATKTKGEKDKGRSLADWIAESLSLSELWWRLQRNTHPGSLGGKRSRSRLRTGRPFLNVQPGSDRIRPDQTSKEKKCMSYHIWRRCSVCVWGWIRVWGSVGVIVWVPRQAGADSAPAALETPASVAAVDPRGSPGAFPLVYDEVDGHLALQAAYISMTKIIAEFVDLKKSKENMC